MARGNMKLLREYIRTLLEWEANFGEKLWAKLAKPDSRHFGDEPDTEEVKGKEQSVKLTGVLKPIVTRCIGLISLVAS